MKLQDLLLQKDNENGKKMLQQNLDFKGIKWFIRGNSIKTGICVLEIYHFYDFLLDTSAPQLLPRVYSQNQYLMEIEYFVEMK